MIIKVKNADYSANNLGNIYTLGVVNLNKYEGTKGSAYAKPWVFSQQADNAPYGESSNKFGIYLKNGISNPTGLDYIHALRWTSAVHQSATTDSMYVSIKMSSYGYPLPTNAQKVQLGFWINKTQWDLVDIAGTKTFIVCLGVSPNNPISSSFGIFTEGTYQLTMSSDNAGKGFTGQTVTVSHKETKVIGGSTWLYICLAFDCTYSSDNVQPNVYVKIGGVSKYLVDNSLDEFEIYISGVTATTSEKELVPSFNYPWVDYVP